LRRGCCARPFAAQKEFALSSFHSRAASRRKRLIAERAAEFRAFSTWSEQILWGAIRGSALGAQFRRQVPVGPSFIADFYAAELRLIVEVDGLIHARKSAVDLRRTAMLSRLGFVVLRLPSDLVEQQLPVALARIRQAIAQLRGQ
jgi:very-short-patch-repair endonuclease